MVDVLFVNVFHLPVNSGIVVFALALFAALFYGIYRTQIISDGWTGRAWNEETEAYDGDYHASLSASIAKRKAFYRNLYGCNIYRTDSW